MEKKLEIGHPLDTLVLTSDGWKCIKDLQIGETLFNEKGEQINLLEVINNGTLPVYRIKNTDETYMDACLDNKWYTYTHEEKKRSRPGKKRKTSIIKDTLIDKFGQLNHFMLRNEAIQFDEKDLSFPPYTLGALLGDGHISNNIQMTSIDEDIVNKIDSEVYKFECKISHEKNSIHYNIISIDVKNKKPARRVRLTNNITGEIKEYHSVGECFKNTNINLSCLKGRLLSGYTVDNIKYEFLECPVRWTNPVKNELEKLNLTDTRHYNKFVPDIYKLGSIEQRLEVLRGLLDTDGTVAKNGNAEFCTTCLQLAKDVQEITKSLGGRVCIKSRDRIGKQTIIKGRTVTTKKISYEFSVSVPNKYNPFYLPRKANKFSQKYIQRRVVTSIDYIGDKEVAYLKVCGKSKMFIINDFLVACGI